LRFLERRQHLRTRDVATMLRSWLDGKVSTEKLAQWVADMKPVADVTDWEDFGGEMGEVSIALNVLSELDFLLNGRGVPVADLACEAEHLRKFAPLFLRLLDDPRSLPEHAAELEAFDLGSDC